MTRKRLQKFCSQKCASKDAYTRRHDYYQNYWLNKKGRYDWKVKALCALCGKEFVKPQPIAKFCSLRCRRKTWKAKHRNKVNAYQRERFKRKVRERQTPNECVMCFREFMPHVRKPNQLTCDEFCLGIYQYLSTRELTKRILKDPTHPKYLLTKHRKRVQDTNYKAKKRGCSSADCTKHHIHLKDWLELKEAIGNKCAHCGKKESKKLILTIDHKVPLSLGGHNTMQNIQPLCRSCNSRKGNRFLN
jgi:5-methylcytosine-specific restriction endonuclease McrA